MKKRHDSKYLKWAEGFRLIFLTASRHESEISVMREIFSALKTTVENFDCVKAIYPARLNPQLEKAAQKIFGGEKRIKIIDPSDVESLHNIIAEAYLIITDDKETLNEAVYFGIPALVLGNASEYQEGETASPVGFVGLKERDIYKAAKTLLLNKGEYEIISKAMRLARKQEKI